MKSALMQEWETLKSMPLSDLRQRCLIAPDGPEHILALEGLLQRADAPPEEVLAIALHPRLWQHKDEHVRWLMVSLVGRRAPHLAVEALAEALLDSSWMVRQHAMQALNAAIDELGQESIKCATFVKFEFPVLANLLYLLRCEQKELRSKIETLLAKNVDRYGAELVDYLEDRLVYARGFEKASLIRAVINGLLLLSRRDESSLIVTQLTLNKVHSLLKAHYQDRAVTVRRACADCSILVLREWETQLKRYQMDLLIYQIWVQLLKDPHSSVRSIISGHCNSTLAKEFARLTLENVNHSQPYFPGLTELLRTLSQLSWSLQTEKEVKVWAKIASQYSSYPNFATRRAARLLWDALGERAHDSLIQTLKRELMILDYDKKMLSELERAAAISDNSNPNRDSHEIALSDLEFWLKVSQLLGGWETYQSVLKMNFPQPLQSRAVETLHAISLRLFSTRTATSILWKIPDNVQGKGVEIRLLLRKLEEHSCPFLSRAAQKGF